MYTPPSNSAHAVSWHPRELVIGRDKCCNDSAQEAAGIPRFIHPFGILQRAIDNGEQQVNPPSSDITRHGDLPRSGDFERQSIAYIGSRDHGWELFRVYGLPRPK